MDITSKENPVFKELKKISKSSNSFFLIEGKKLLAEAINSNLDISQIFIDKKNKEKFSNLLPKDKNYKLIFMDNDLISSLFTTASKPTAQDLILSVASRPKWELKNIFQARKHLVLLENIQDPSNLGLVLRSAFAFSASGVILLNSCVDPFNTKVIRASAGTVFHIPVIKASTFKDIEQDFKKENYKIIGTSSKAIKKITDLGFKSSYLFLFGNEGTGLSEDLTKHADEIISIPHSKNVESLNLGIAVSIILWEAMKRK